MGTRANHIISRRGAPAVIPVDCSPTPADLVIHGVAMSTAGALLFSMIAAMSMFAVVGTVQFLAEAGGIVDEGMAFARFALLVGACFGGAASAITIGVRVLCDDPRSHTTQLAAAMAALLPALALVAHDVSSAGATIAAAGRVALYLTAIAAAAGASFFARVPERWVA